MALTSFGTEAAVPFALKLSFGNGKSARQEPVDVADESTASYDKSVAGNFHRLLLQQTKKERGERLAE